MRKAESPIRSCTPSDGSDRYRRIIWRAVRDAQRVKVAVAPFKEFDVVRDNQVVTLHQGDELLATDHRGGAALSAQLTELAALGHVISLSDEELAQARARDDNLDASLHGWPLT